MFAYINDANDALLRPKIYFYTYVTFQRMIYNL